MLITSIQQNLDQLRELVTKLPAPDYSRPFPELSNATIGGHLRHILEMFRTLADGYASGLIDYDSRKRDELLETVPTAAIGEISLLRRELDKPDKPLELAACTTTSGITISTNYMRELLYTLEHSIHHQALIKVAVMLLKNVELPEDFGVARSTIEYRKQCAP